MSTYPTSSNPMKGALNVNIQPGAASHSPQYCSAHLERYNQKRIASHAGLCQECLDGVPMNRPEPTIGRVASEVRMLKGEIARLNSEGLFLVRQQLREIRRELQELKRVRRVEKREGTVTVETVVEMVAKEWGLNPAEMFTVKNRHDICRSRAVAMYLFQAHSGASLGTIGRLFGGFHHTSALHGIRTVKAKLEKDAAFRQRVERVQNLLTKYSERTEITA